MRKGCPEGRGGQFLEQVRKGVDKAATWKATATVLVKVKMICPKRTAKSGAQAVRDKEVCHLRRKERGASLWSQQFLTGLGTLRGNSPDFAIGGDG